MRNNNLLVIRNLITLSIVLCATYVNGQSITPVLPEIKPPLPSLYPSGTNSLLTPSANQPSSNDNNYQRRQNQQIMNEVDKNEKLREQTMQSVQSDIKELRSTIYYDLPSLSKMPGSKYYRDVFDQMLNIDIDNYSVKDVNFQIENAYFENQKGEKEEKIGAFSNVILQVLYLRSEFRLISLNIANPVH